MNLLLDLYHKGGPAIVAIAGLSVLLYARCFNLLLWLRRERRLLNAALDSSLEEMRTRRQRQDRMRETFRQQRTLLGAMIAAAPLLGLLGTVSGMASAFENLSNQAGGKSMEGLAGGISEVLLSTESGLAVAVPAMLLVYLAHRTLHGNRPQPGRRPENLRAGIPS
jgi:biopolymer transport protein ExbB